MEIVFLGTSAAVPTRQRNLPSFVLLYNGEQVLFDAGEDVQRQFEAAGLKFNVPLSIFISHMHGDHLIGLPGLLFHFTLVSRTQEVKIWGPPGIFPYLYLHRMVTGLRAPFLKEVYEIHSELGKLLLYDYQGKPDQKPVEISFEENKIHETANYVINAIPMYHSVPTTGFKFLEKPRPGRFVPKIAEKIGIPRGHLWKKMQMGEIIKYKGQTYNPVELGIVGPKRPGIIISYSADTKICDALHFLAKGSDVFICEATYGNELKDLAEEKKHMTATQGAQVAHESDVRQLILTHISSRYSEVNNLLEEARSIFPNSLIAHDLMRLTPLKD